MIALIDYGAGNLRSVENALARLGADCAITAEPAEVVAATAIVFPGVGAAGPAMAALRDRGLDRAVTGAIRRGVPFLGICLGMQLLFESSAEDGASGLGVLPGTVERLQTDAKLPHVGWNTVERVRPHPVLDGMEGEAFYFVHSYVVVPADADVPAAETAHGARFVSAIARDRLVGVQFHPERSGRAGLRLLANFVRFTAGERGSALRTPPSRPLSVEGAGT
ncbi:MAG TPA: imidazole glycerol phosphate synthase subunit HisH [Candidatus Limnocylindrales bacterium]|nr:imidazole glycerol phosphate synthase subunit HisH [Candidatus Limnocylindrales bacterium]